MKTLNHWTVHLPFLFMKPLAQALLTFATTLLILLCTAFNYPPSVFGEKLDAAWREGREAEIPGMIEERLAQKPGNLLALIYGYHFFIYCEPNMEKAATYETQLKSKFVELRKRAEAQGELSLFEEVTNEVPLIDIEQVKSKDWDTLVDWKKDSPNEIPFSLTIQIDALFLARFDEEAAEEVRENYRQFQQEKLSIINDAGFDHFKADVFRFIEESSRVPEGTSLEQIWPESFKKLKPKSVACNTSYATFLFYRMASTYDGMEVRFDGTEPFEVHYTTYEKLTNGVYWYHSSL